MIPPKPFQFCNEIIQIIFNIEKEKEAWKIAKFEVKNTNFQVNKQDKSPSSLSVLQPELVEQYLWLQ